MKLRKRIKINYGHYYIIELSLNGHIIKWKRKVELFKIPDNRGKFDRIEAYNNVDKSRTLLFHPVSK